MKLGRESLQTVAPATETARWPYKCLVANEILRKVDGWQNADAGECQHRWEGRSSPTGTVMRGRSDIDELSPPAWRTTGRDVEPVKFIVQYLTHAAVKLPSAGETRATAFNFLNWIEQGSTSHQTHHRLYRGRVSRVKRPNQQCHCTEGR